MKRGWRDKNHTLILIKINRKTAGRISVRLFEKRFSIFLAPLHQTNLTLASLEISETDGLELGSFISFDV